MPARDKPLGGKPWTPQVVRDRIKAALIQKHLQEHALGQREMSVSQIKAATYLLSQAIGAPPQAIEHSGLVRHISEIADAELEHIATRGRDRASEETGSTEVGRGIH